METVICIILCVIILAVYFFVGFVVCDKRDDGLVNMEKELQ